MRGRAVAAAVLATGMALVSCGDDGDGAVRAGAEPRAGTWKTWVLSSPSQIAVPAPPEGSAADAERKELKDLAGRRTPEVEEAVAHWGQEPATKPWTDLNVEIVTDGVKDPPLSSRGYALTSVAVYDAVVAAYHWKYEYDRKPPSGVTTLSPPGPDPSYPSEHAAIAGAASRVLAYVFPDRPAARFDELAEQAALSRVWAGANYRSDVEAGLALGRSVADAVIARAKTDGADAKWDGTRPPMTKEHWVPAPGQVTPPTSPLAGTWKTWVLTSGSQFRPPPPPPYGSPAFVAEARHVLEVSRNLTQQQRDIASFWAAGQGTALPAGQWNQIALIYAQAAKLDTPRAARAFALLNVAEADAGVAVWDAKFTYWHPRPVNAIRDLGLDPEWKPVLVTPPFPGYVSGHSGYSGAAAEVLSYLFPTAAADFRAKAEEAAVSRLYGGIHFHDSDNVAGLVLGRKVGEAVVTRAKADGADGVSA